MGLSLREWLIIGGAIIVALIVLDGWRRMRGSRNTLKMHIDESLADIPEETHNPELPGGGFRVIEPDGQITTVDSRKEPEFRSELEPEFKTTPPSEGLAADNNGASMRAEPELRRAAAFDSVDQQEERDPLFEPLEDFSDYNEGVSAVRIIPTPDADVQQARVADVEAGSIAESELAIGQSELISTEEKVSRDEKLSTEKVADSIFDLPVISDIAAESKQQGSFAIEDSLTVEDSFRAEDSFSVEDSFRAEDSFSVEDSFRAEDSFPVEDSFPADDDIENSQVIAAADPPAVSAIKGDSVGQLRASRLDSIEDDDLIASLPEDFTLFHDEVVEQEEPSDIELDLSRPVTELMRKARNEQPEPLQESMELIAERVKASEPVPEPVITVGKVSVPLVAEGFVRDKSDRLLGTDEQETAVETFTAGRSLQDIPEPGNVLVISVVAPASQPSFYGRSLLQILLACGMRFGDMQIFHRCEDGIDQGAIQFSMANAHEPGYFDIDKMDTFETRGVTFFMSMDEPRDVMNAYECMLATAEAVAKNLEGELLDENHSTMRTQTKEHYRERIRKFEMRKLKQQH